ncbi:hypothetical protein PFTANZ_06135, partial [Plasmodium falciparum Tanzania (2000708)]
DGENEDEDHSGSDSDESGEEDDEDDDEVQEEEATQPKEPAPTAPKKKEVDVCEKVKGLLEGKDGETTINGCNKKEDKDWTCKDADVETTNTGACMPPRRQSLCLHDLTVESDTNDKDKLKDAFIRCVAKEIHFLWHKYKKHKIQDDKLKTGTIPEDFKRQMFYTFGDYRDLCVGTDISKLNTHTQAVKTNIDRIFPPTEPTNDTIRKEFWEKNAESIWQGMLCALSYNSNDKKMDPNVQKALTGPTSKYQYNIVTFSGNNSPTLEKFAQTPQFLRWFIEWSDEFCRTRGVKIKDLEEGCKRYECNISDEDTKKKCEKECKVYEQFIKQWKPQYEQQSKKFTKDKEKTEYNGDPDVKNSTHAYEYLSKKLKPICQSGTTTDKCDYTCMENASKQPQTSACSQEQQQQGNTSPTPNHFPEAFDCPPKEIGDKCNCPKLPEPKYCVDKTAYDIRKDAETKVKNMDKSMKGKGNDFNSECNKVQKNDAANGENSCNFDKKYKKSLDNINETCKGKGVDRLKIGQKWNSKYIRSIGKYLYIPPRRQHMCINNLNEIGRYFDINNLLKTIQQAAKNEGDDIIKKLSTQYPRNKDVICKAMKYSFADLGDIIRGTDIYTHITDIEIKLKPVFETIYKNWKSSNSNNNKDKYTNVQTFRSAWWDTNRKEIWKAMTCNAPYDAKIYITKEGGYISPLTSTKNHCGHNDDPPDYDYIPQPLRWISEWGESYCLAQRDFLETMKICENCKKKNDNTDCEQTKYGACRDCKKKCEEYRQFVENWKTQFETQDKAYKEIYRNATSNGGKGEEIDENTKNFVKELEKNCKTDQKTSVDSADKYLENGGVCRRFKFVKTNTHIKNYAFHHTPPSYEEHCQCAKNFDPLDECPVDNNECKKYIKYVCPKKKFNNELEAWTHRVIRRNPKNYEDVIVPARTRQLCLQNVTRNLIRIKNEKEFKEQLLISAASEAKLLSEQYHTERDKAFQAIKYSFADIGNIIKGDDIIGNVISVQLHKLINGNKKINTSTLWWEANKEKIWNVMMCHYNGSDKKKDRCPSHGDIDEEDQFLRWMTEWATYFCNEKKKEVQEEINRCREQFTQNKYSSVDEIKKGSCYKVLHKYNHWLHNRNNEWKNLEKKYEADYKENSSSTSMPQNAQKYIDEKCNDCKCNFDEIIEKYDKSGNGISIIHSFIKEHHPEKRCDQETSVNEDIKAPEKDPSSDPPSIGPQPPSLPEYDSTNDILKTTIPVGIALALGSIAFLFMK